MESNLQCRHGIQIAKLRIRVAQPLPQRCEQGGRSWGGYKWANIEIDLSYYTAILS